MAWLKSHLLLGCLDFQKPVFTCLSSLFRSVSAGKLSDPHVRAPLGGHQGGADSLSAERPMDVGEESLAAFSRVVVSFLWPR